VLTIVEALSIIQHDDLGHTVSLHSYSSCPFGTLQVTKVCTLTEVRSQLLFVEIWIGVALVNKLMINCIQKLSHARGGQLDELWEPHVSTQLRQEPRINKVNKTFLFILWLLISVHQITIGKFQLAVSLLSLGNISECHWVPAWRVHKLQEYYFYRQTAGAMLWSCQMHANVRSTYMIIISNITDMKHEQSVYTFMWRLQVHIYNTSIN
jgi:hypothetical protein